MTTLVKPPDCTCAYPRLVARNMCGHTEGCVVFERFFAEIERKQAEAAPMGERYEKRPEQVELVRWEGPGHEIPRLRFDASVGSDGCYFVGEFPIHPGWYAAYGDGFWWSIPPGQLPEFEKRYAKVSE